MVNISFLTLFIFNSFLPIDQWQKEITSNTLIEPIVRTDKYSDNGHLTISGFAVFEDKYGKFKNTILNTELIIKWLFVVKYNNQVRGELWHHGIHDHISCNVLSKNSILFHINTVGRFALEIFAKMFIFTVDKGTDGVSLYGILDKSFEQPGIDKINDLGLSVQAIPHPFNKKWTIVIIKLDILSNWPISKSEPEKYLKWQVENMVFNFGEQLK